MKELIDIKPNINVLEAEYKRLLGYPHHYELKDRSRELADWAREWYNKNGKPWIYAIRIDDVDFSNERLKINDIEFSSQKLYNQLIKANANSVMLAAVSSGRECEEMSSQLWRENKPDEYFFLEIYGSAVTEHLITNAGAKLCAWADENNLAVLPHYSPGYPGWNITEQNKLLKLIEQNNKHDLPGKIEVLETGMLKPKKSLLALFGFTTEIEKVRKLSGMIPCETCSFQGCQYRRTTYKYSRKQVEDVSKLQPKDNEYLDSQQQHSNKNGKPVLTKNAKYNISTKALQKWANERLKLKFSEDNSVEANFRYEGTTCSNMGHPLEFDFNVKLSSHSECYKIISIDCTPSPGDNGYKYMCDYINDPDYTMNSIENHKPFVGSFLDEILSSEYQFNPEGCLCKPESRQHKWGIVMEVLHYALVQHENKFNNVSQLIET